AAGLRGQSRLHRSEPSRRAQRGHGPARRAAHRSRPGAGRGVAADPRRRAGRPRGARRARPGRLAEDQRLAGRPPLGPGPAGPDWPFTQVRRAALAFAREVERRAPDIATAKWWKEERRGVFLDYNQNARDRTTASAYSVRPTPDARVSMPLAWDELLVCDPHD